MSRGDGEAPTIRDPELRAVLPSIPAGVVTTLFVVAATVPYVLSTWGEPNRTAILCLTAFAGLAASALLLLPMEQLLERPHVRDFFFLSWTAADVGIIAAIAILDGGVSSPFTVLLFLTQAFAAVFYPPRLVAWAAGMNLVALGAIAALGGPHEITATLFVAAALMGTSLLCAWAAVNAATQRRELARASRTDPLTGCLNRLGLEERIELEVARADRSYGFFALVIVDLDDFKLVNDELGHAAGDRVLRAIVAAMGDVVRGMDSVGRLGGDEFALVFPDARHAGLPALLSRVHSAVAALAPCSLGAACYPEDGTSADRIIAAADRAMYADKRRSPEPAPRGSAVLKPA